MSGVFHVVCHSCTLESIRSVREIAQDEAYTHRERTGHDVEYMEVA